MGYDRLRSLIMTWSIAILIMGVMGIGAVAVEQLMKSIPKIWGIVLGIVVWAILMGIGL